MRKGIGIFCIVVGIACLLGSFGLVIYNRQESQSGAEFSQTLLQDMKVNMEKPEHVDALQAESGTEESYPVGMQETKAG